jgi:ADP-dependent NAD(P)H-hydrate dehydratase / NAD(P)H-hydrate epimerase
MSVESSVESLVVTAGQMQQIEERVFAAGMPVAALMEKVAGRIVQRLHRLYPQLAEQQVGVLVGPGHNGGDALVVARELHFHGCDVQIYCPFDRLKPLTEDHANYAKSLGIPFVNALDHLYDCDWVVDGLFGFGLKHSIMGDLAREIEQFNQQLLPVVSIDLPSGLNTDTGQVMGTAVQATHTLCLGLWKQGLLQDHALDYVGDVQLVEFDLPLADIRAVLSQAAFAGEPVIQRITPTYAIAQLPLQRLPTAHKYTLGHLLLVCGSRRYSGAAILTALGARASGVGMLSIAVPQSLKPLLLAQVPEALILDCPETAAGDMAALPEGMDLSIYDAIACGPGLTTQPEAIVQAILASDAPLILDADGLNILAQFGTVPTLHQRLAPTILTPHLGEFKRLFPDLATDLDCRITATHRAAQQTGAIVLLKGARVTIADGRTVWVNPSSTPALARGGSGDILTGLMGGLLAQSSQSSLPPIHGVTSATWWHAQAGRFTAHERTELGVDAYTLSRCLIPALHQLTS